MLTQFVIDFISLYKKRAVIGLSCETMWEIFLRCFQNEAQNMDVHVELASWEAKVMSKLKVLEGEKCLIKTELARNWTRDTESWEAMQCNDWEKDYHLYFWFSRWHAFMWPSCIFFHFSDVYKILYFIFNECHFHLNWCERISFEWSLMEIFGHYVLNQTYLHYVEYI